MGVSVINDSCFCFEPTVWRELFRYQRAQHECRSPSLIRLCAASEMLLAKRFVWPSSSSFPVAEGGASSAQARS